MKTTEPGRAAERRNLDSAVVLSAAPLVPCTRRRFTWYYKEPNVQGKWDGAVKVLAYGAA